MTSGPIVNYPISATSRIWMFDMTQSKRLCQAFLYPPPLRKAPPSPQEGTPLPSGRPDTQVTRFAAYGSRKGTIQKYFANPKKYFKSQCVFKNHCRRVCQIQKTITNPKKISGSTNNSFNNSKIFCKSIKTISILGCS